MRSDEPTLRPNATAAAVITKVLTRSRPETMEATAESFRKARLRSIEKPTVMKKRPSKRPRNGLISASTWWRNLVSASMTPARKAPKVSDRPRTWVRDEVAKTVNRITAMKASELFALATKRKTGWRKFLPMMKMKVSAAAAFTDATEMARTTVAAPPDPASSGVRTRTGTTARSWNRRIPKAARPYRVPTSPLSDSNCKTNALEERASPAPRTIAAWVEIPSKVATKDMTAPVMRNCEVPRPKTSAPRDLSFDVESSRPISNKKKTTPNSARFLLVRTSRMRAKPLGPRAMPAARKPRMGEMPKRPARGMIMTVVRRRRRASPSAAEWLECTS